MQKKRMTSEAFDKLAAGNRSQSVKGSRMVLVDGITYREAASITGVSPSSITQAIHRLERRG